MILLLEEAALEAKKSVHLVNISIQSVSSQDDKSPDNNSHENWSIDTSSPDHIVKKKNYRRPTCSQNRFFL